MKTGPHEGIGVMIQCMQADKQNTDEKVDYQVVFWDLFILWQTNKKNFLPCCCFLGFVYFMANPLWSPLEPLAAARKKKEVDELVYK